MRRIGIVVAGFAAGWACAAAAQAPSESALRGLAPSQVEALLEDETRRQHERRVQAYEQLKGRLDMSISASSEARNLAVGSALQMLTPVTDVKVQQLQQQRLSR